MINVTLGKYMKIIAGRFFNRIYHPLRLIFDQFDNWTLNKDEVENWHNIERFRGFVRQMI
jgi:hypothetical protein